MAGDQVAPAPQFVRPLLVQLAQYAQGFAIISRTKLQPADQISTIVARLQCVGMHDSLLFGRCPEPSATPTLSHCSNV
jgi:hypothetical protein